MINDSNIYSIIQEPLPDDVWEFSDLDAINTELNSIQQEIDAINIDKIPFDKTDWAFVAVAALLGAAFDILAFLGNSSDNPIGALGDKIHKNVKHPNQPIDFQGGFDKTGNFIKNGDGKKDISFGGPWHRFSTHDIALSKEKIQQIMDGEFRGFGFVDGVRVDVSSTCNQNGIPYLKFSKEEATRLYRRHMLADFFSPEGLPMPFTSDILGYCSAENVERILKFLLKIFENKGLPTKFINTLKCLDAHKVRKVIFDLYKDGLNIRSELEKGLAFLFPEALIQLYVGFKYKKWLQKKEGKYSDEAIEQHKNLMLLMSHGIVAAANLLIVVVAKNPIHLNLATMLRVAKLGFSCVQDQIRYNQRVVAKVSMASIRTQLQFEETLIICGTGFYRTRDYTHFCQMCLADIDANLSDRQFRLDYLRLALSDYKKINWIDNLNVLSTMCNNVNIELLPNENLETLVDRCPIVSDNLDINYTEIYNSVYYD